MQFRIISDLHVDINNKYYSKFKFDPKAFYLIAGDIAGSRFKVGNFLDHYNYIGKLNKCLFVAGNHLGYEHDTYDNTKEACCNYLSQEFPLTSDISFLQNDYKDIGEDIIVVGCALYTDFQLFNNKDLAMSAVEYFLNDFKYVRTYDGNGEDRKVRATDYVRWFDTSIKYIDKVCNANPNKRIVVLTHHAPSIQSVSEQYKSDIVSAGYASNLENFILDHPNIKLWVHGHIHSISDYTIGECRIVCNPFGYWNENEMKLTRYIGMPVRL